MISLGPWNKIKIKKNLGIDIDEITFPFEPKEYWVKSDWKNKFKKKDTFKIVIYLKYDGKRGPTFLLMALEELYEQIKSKGYNLKLMFFGSDKRFKHPLSVPHTNLGRPSKVELRKLYQESDFGIVFSYTNISLVPLEMIACGCPVVEVKEGSFTEFFDANCAILVESYPKDFARKILWYMEHPDERLKISENAQGSLKNMTWEDAAIEFEKLILHGYNNHSDCD